MYGSKSKRELQIDTELIEIGVLILKMRLFPNIHNLPVHSDTCSLVSQAPEYLQHKYFGLLSETGVFTRHGLPHNA
jgi:hypothetical protein